MAKKIRIVSRIDGFRRGGKAHPKTVTFHDLDAFTKEQLEAIKTEPNLIVDEVDVEDDTKESGDAKKAPPSKK
ncbi:MAG: hypothetical protein HQL35_04935 [Alphaproteobacteria bacterium]|nr:hypothetical protein [Alphaproteobacteria bacterium]